MASHLLQVADILAGDSHSLQACGFPGRIVDKVRKSTHKILDEILGDVSDGVRRTLLRSGFFRFRDDVGLRKILLDLPEYVLFLFVAALFIVANDEDVLLAVGLDLLPKPESLVPELLYHFEGIVSFWVFCLHSGQVKCDIIGYRFCVFGQT